MNILKSLAQWTREKKLDFDSLSELQIVIAGEENDLTPPFIGFVESGSSLVEQGEVVLHGVSSYEVTVELVTVPASEEEQGTPSLLEQQMRFDLYNILANRDAIESINGLNNWTIFDIRASGPTTEAQDGNRISRFLLTVIASPN